MDLCFIKKSDPRKLLAFLTSRKDRIGDILLKRLKEFPATPYMKFLLETSDGQDRISIYFSNFKNAVKGQIHTFINDLREIGYIRAIQGHQLEDVWRYTLAFKQAFSEAVLEYNAETPHEKGKINIEDVSFIHELIDYGNYTLSFSFIRRRDEIINRRRNQIHQLNNYAIQVVSIFEEKSIWDCAGSAVLDIFGLSGSFREIRKNEIQVISKILDGSLPEERIEKILYKMDQKRDAMAFDTDGNQYQLRTEMEKESFTYILAPIHTGPFPVKHFLLIHDQGRIFKFDKFDRNLFFQFCILTGSVIYNCKMVSELSRRQEDLHKLSRSLMTVQENERKKIAGDIHDTLTQTLTAMGYKALLCQELAEKNIERMKTVKGSPIKGRVKKKNTSPCKKLSFLLGSKLRHQHGVV